MKDRYSDISIGPMVMATRPTSHGSRKMYAALLSRPLAFFSAAVIGPLRRLRVLSSLMALIAATPFRAAGPRQPAFLPGAASWFCV